MTAPAVITWDVSADFARTGGGTYATALKSYIIAPFTLTRGVDTNAGLPQAGSVSFVLENKTGIFTRANTTGALYGKLLPGVPIRVRYTSGGTYAVTDQELWYGFIQRYTPSANFQSVTIQCAGIIESLGRMFPSVAQSASTGFDTDGGAHSVMLSIGKTASDEQFTDGIIDLPYHWVDRTQSASANIAAAQRCEMAPFPNVQEYEGGTGRPRLASYPQNGVLHATPIDIGDDHATRKPWYVHAEDRYEDRIGGVKVTYNSFVDSAAGYVYTHSKNRLNSTPDSILIPSKGTVVIAGAYSTGLARAVTTPIATTDYTANDAVGGGGTDRTANVTVRSFADWGTEFDATLYNDHTAGVYLTRFEVPGVKVTKTANSVTFSAPLLDDPGAPVTTIDLPFVSDIGKIQKFATSYLFPRRIMRPIYTFSIDGTDEEKQQVVINALGIQPSKSLVNLKDTAAALLGSYVNDYVRIETEAKTISPAARGSGVAQRGTFTGRPSWSYVNPGACIFDFFDRPDNATDLGTTPTGDVWTNSGGGFKVLSGKARPKSVASCIAWFDLGSANFSMAVRIENLTSDADEQAGVLWRQLDANNRFVFYWDDTGDKFVSYKVVAGATTLYTDIPFTPRSDGVMELFLNASGNRNRIWVDGSLLWEQTTASLNTNTIHGFFTGSTDTVDYDRVWIAAC